MEITKEIAAALMIAAGNENGSAHPDILEYIDSDEDYNVPETITPASGETFDTVTETWNAEEQGGEDTIVKWGVGIIGKDTDSEIVNRLIYPDGTYISLINFNGDGGLG